MTDDFFISPILRYLAHGVNSGTVDPKELIATLKTKLTEIETTDGKIKLVKGIENIRTKRNADTFRISACNEFFVYAAYLKEELELTKKLENDPNNKRFSKDIPTKGTYDDVLEFWLKLTSSNSKGEPYWEDKAEIEHFVNQSFKVGKGVEKNKKFNPNMTITQLYQTVYLFYRNFKDCPKDIYVELLKSSFVRLSGKPVSIKNIKDYFYKDLNDLLG